MNRLSLRTALGRWARATPAAVRGFLAHDGPLAAAAVSYYALFSLFPLTLLALAVTAFLLPDLPARWSLLPWVEAYLPGGGQLVRENMARLVRFRSGVGFLGLLFLLWSASSVFAALSRALERAAGRRGPRSPLRARLLALIMVLATAVLLALALLGATLLAAAARHDLALNWSPPGTPAPVDPGDLGALTHGAGLVLVFGAILAVYRLAPAGAPPVADLWPGALVATLGLHLARMGFAAYMATLSPHELLYGSIGAVIVTLLWFYLSAAILILGMEFNAALRR